MEMRAHFTAGLLARGFQRGLGQVGIRRDPAPRQADLGLVQVDRVDEIVQAPQGFLGDRGAQRGAELDARDAQAGALETDQRGQRVLKGHREVAGVQAEADAAAQQRLGLVTRAAAVAAEPARSLVQQLVFEPPDDIVRGFQQAVGFGFQREDDVAVRARRDGVQQLRHDRELPDAHRHPLILDFLPLTSDLCPFSLIAERYGRDAAGLAFRQQDGKDFSETAGVCKPFGCRPVRFVNRGFHGGAVERAVWETVDAGDGHVTPCEQVGEVIQCGGRSV